jgi:hypothetical protein
MRILLLLFLSSLGFSQAIEDYACAFPFSISSASPAKVTCPVPHGFNRSVQSIWNFLNNPDDGSTITLDGVVYTFVSSLNNAVPNQVLKTAANGFGPYGWIAANLVHAINDDGIGKGAVYSNATVAHPTMNARWIGWPAPYPNTLYNYVFLYYNVPGQPSTPIAVSSSTATGSNAHGNFSPGSGSGPSTASTLRMSWNVNVIGGTGAWAPLGSNATPGNYYAVYHDASSFDLYSLSWTYVSTSAYGSYAGQNISIVRANAGQTSSLPSAYQGQSFSITGKVDPSSRYYQIHIPGCPVPAHEAECALAYYSPQAGKFGGTFQTSPAGMAVTSGVGTLSFSAPFPYAAIPQGWKNLVPGVFLWTQNFVDTPGYNNGGVPWTHTSTYTNDSANPTVTGHLVKFSPVGSSTVGAIGYSDQGGAIGVCVSGCGSSGTATIADAGMVNCVFDGATTAGHWVSLPQNVLNGTKSDMCHDTGTVNYTTMPQNVGVVQSTNAAAGTYQVWWARLNGGFTAISVGGTGTGCSPIWTGPPATPVLNQTGCTGQNVMSVAFSVPNYPDGTYPSVSLYPTPIGGPSSTAFADSNFTASAYVNWNSSGSNFSYAYNQQAQAKNQAGLGSGVNRMSWNVKWGGVPYLHCAQIGNFELGTYTIAPHRQGSYLHYYSSGSENTYPNQWASYVFSAVPTHDQGISEPGIYNYPANPTLVGGPIQSEGAEGLPFFSALQRFYMDLHDGNIACNQPTNNQSILISAPTFGTVLGEPDELIPTKGGTWSPGLFQPGDTATTGPTGPPGYDINWTAPRGYPFTYEFRYSTTGSLKTAGFSTGLCQNGTTSCTSADRVTVNDNTYPYAQYQSGSLAQAPNIWWGIKPISVPVLTTSGSGTSPIWIVTPVDMMLSAVGDHITVAGVGGNTAANATNAATVAALSWQDWRAYDRTQRSISSEGWPANPGGQVKLTLDNHGLTTGQLIQVWGMTPANISGRQYALTVLDANTITLDGSSYDTACPSGCTGGSLRVDVPSTLTSIAADGAGICTANLTVNHNLTAGWPIYVYGSANSAYAGGLVTANISGGAVISAPIAGGGELYVTPPSCSISSSIGASGATCTTTLTNGVVTAINITAGGSGYTAATTTVTLGSLTPGVNVSSNATGAVSRTVVSTPTAQSFTFGCPNVGAGTYNQDYNPNIYLGITAFPGVAVAGTGNGTYTSGGTLLSTEDKTNFAEINLPAFDSSAGLTSIPTALTFACTVGTNPPAQSVAISSYGAPTLDNWTATKTQSWLTLSATSGSAAGSFNASAACPSSVGTLTDTITIASTTAGIASPITIPVSVTASLAPTIAVTTASLPDGLWTSPYAQTLAASGGTQPYTWTVAAGSLPPGLTLNSATGVISGTPGIPTGVANFWVRITDSAGHTSPQQALTINIASPGASFLTGGFGILSGH